MIVYHLRTLPSGQVTLPDHGYLLGSTDPMASYFTPEIIKLNNRARNNQLMWVLFKGNKRSIARLRTWPLSTVVFKNTR